MSPSWQPTHAGGSVPDGDVRVGTVRNTMKTNPLLVKPELGKVKKMMFNNPSEEHAFGYTAPPDPEGAREVTMLWKEHAPSQGKDTRPDGKPHLDFTAMNKLASISGLTTAKQLPAFRESHQVAVKKGDPTAKAAPTLPSDKNPKHTYGIPSAYRPAEVQRSKGLSEPPIKHLVQGAYQHEWIAENLAKGEEGGRPYIPPVPTRAVVGHAIGAQQKYLRNEEAGEEWKMSKFKTVPSRVTQYMPAKSSTGGTQSGQQTMQQEEAYEQPAQADE